MKIRIITAFPADQSGLAERRAKVPPGVVEPETELEIVGVRPGGVLLMDSYYNLALHEPILVEAGLDAERAGCDAVVVDTVSDLAVNALRSRLDIPVLGGGQAAYATASLLGRRFSIVTRWARWKFLHNSTLDAYGARVNCASIRAPELPARLAQQLPGLHAGEAAALVEADDEYWEAFLVEGQRAVANDGADVLIVASMTMQRAATLLRENINVPVIDPGPLALRTAESLVRLGLTHSKLAYQPPTRLHDEDFTP